MKHPPRECAMARRTTEAPGQTWASSLKANGSAVGQWGARVPCGLQQLAPAVQLAGALPARGARPDIPPGAVVSEQMSGQGWWVCVEPRVGSMRGQGW